METKELAVALGEAQAAYEANDAATMVEKCNRVLEADPENVQAWLLLAKFGGWDSKLYRLDVDFACDAAKHALNLLPDASRREEAANVYVDRKRQIALLLESEMTMPSHTSAKQLHQTMLDWKRLLEEIPYLSANLIEGEVSLCNNLCLRSKLGIMPGDRLVATAYATFNGKESYGETFRKALAGRIEAQRKREAQEEEDAKKRANELLAAAEACLGEDAARGEEQALRLRELASALESAIAELEGFTARAQHLKEIDELERRRAKLKRYQVMNRRDADAQLAALRSKVAQIDAGLEPTVGPLRDCLERIQERLA